MENNSIKIILLFLVILMISGCNRQSTNKWLSNEVTRGDELKNLSVDWDESTYTNDHIGFEVAVSNEWIKVPVSELGITEAINDEQYDAYFDGSDTGIDSYPNVITIMQAGSVNKEILLDSIQLFIVPTFNNDIETFMEYRRSLDVEEYGDLDSVNISEITSRNFGREKTISYGIELTFEGEKYYQLYFGYYLNGYFIVFSPSFSENSEEEINQILESVNIY